MTALLKAVVGISLLLCFWWLVESAFRRVFPGRSTGSCAGCMDCRGTCHDSQRTDAPGRPKYQPPRGGRHDNA